MLTAAGVFLITNRGRGQLVTWARIGLTSAKKKKKQTKVLSEPRAQSITSFGGSLHAREQEREKREKQAKESDERSAQKNRLHYDQNAFQNDKGA